MTASIFHHASSRRYRSGSKFLSSNPSSRRLFRHTKNALENSRLSKSSPIIPAPVTSGISAVFCHYSDYKKRFCRQKQSHHHTPVDDKYSFHAAAGLYIRLNSPPSGSKTNSMIPIHNRFDYTTPHHKMHISIPHSCITFYNQ